MGDEHGGARAREHAEDVGRSVKIPLAGIRPGGSNSHWYATARSLIVVDDRIAGCAIT